MVAFAPVAESGAQASDEPSGHDLDIDLADPQWLGGVGSLTLRVPPTDLSPFLGAVAAAKAAVPDGAAPSAGGVVGAAAGLLAGLGASATRRVHARQSGGGAPQHGLGRRRIAPVVVGLLALAMLAGSTTVSFGSSAAVARPGR